ncbi:aldo/keto reductase [Pseudonocardia lutea]|uniref:Aldo/keto reductase n=1 Tax=Pseudonocardia lutea TaxID=2172015 RepID=A0ABW1I3X0_9PSEU
MGDVPFIPLNNGVTIPQLGFGVYRIAPGQTEQAVLAAFEAGYRHIDTAQRYGNEKQVGRALARSGLSRDAVFLTTKLDVDRHGRREAIRELEKSLGRLGTDHVDLYLIHWPEPGADRYVETWTGFEEVLADGRARAIGVSNFTRAHLQRLAAESTTIPAVNQVECHPLFARTRLREFHRLQGIETEAWGPLGQGGPLLAEAEVVRLAHEYGRSPAQIVLRWHVQLGNIVCAKSTRPERMRQNISVVDFALDDADMHVLTALDVGEHRGPDLDHCPGPTGRLRRVARRVPGARRAVRAARALRSR